MDLIEKKINYNFFFYLKNKLKIGTNVGTGRNFSGQICISHICKGNKRNYYYIDYYRRINSFGIIYKILKEINRAAFIGCIIYENGLFSYIILSENISIGDKIYSGGKKKFNISFKTNGYAIPLYTINLFSVINNIEIFPYKGSILSRSAGTSSLLTTRHKKKVILKLKSGWNIYLSKFCIASVGYVSNTLYKFKKLNKAGDSIKLGKRPTVRGVAMNPCDHPHGGGEGKKSKPASHLSPWGWITSGGAIAQQKKYKLIKKKKFKILR